MYNEYNTHKKSTAILAIGRKSLQQAEGNVIPFQTVAENSAFSPSFQIKGLYIKSTNVATFQTYYELSVSCVQLSNLNSEYSLCM
jgi:hypothetical protein